MSVAVSETRHGAVILLEVTAGARSSSFPAGFNEWRSALGCRVTEPALEGRANKAVIRLVAKSLGVPASSVSILSGATSSLKRVLVAGMGRDRVLETMGIPGESGTIS